MRGKCSRSTATLAHVHVEGQVFFSCLASLSGFLKDAKSVYLKTKPFSLCQKMINAVHKATFYFTLCLVFFVPFFCFFSVDLFFFCFHMNYEQVLILCFQFQLFILISMFCAKGPLWKSVNTYVHKYPVYYTFISVYVHAYLCVYEYMYKLRRYILTKD